jgi:hypothetical protein
MDKAIIDAWERWRVREDDDSKVVAKTEQNADDDASVHTNPSTGKGMC